MTSQDSNHDADAALDARIARLVRRAEPDERGWSAISARIDSPRRPGWPWAAAAALLLALTLVATRPDRDAAPDRALQLVQAEADAMRRAAPMLAADWIEPGPWTEAWAENQAAIDELDAALARDPDNRLLLDFLAEARLRQARLIQSGLAHSPQTRMTL